MSAEVFSISARRSPMHFCRISFGANSRHAPIIDLPSSKQLIGEAPGHPQRINSLPISMAVSPDGRYVVTVNAGYGTFESQYEQSLAVLDTQTGALADFPDARTRAAQRSRRSTPASPSAATAATSTRAWLRCPTPRAKAQGDTGSGIVVYSFERGQDCARAPDSSACRAACRRDERPACRADRKAIEGVPYPAAIAVLGAAGHEKLLVAENLTDDAVLLDAATGAIEKRFDLSESDAVPSTYPIAVAVTQRRKARFRRAVERVGDCRARSRAAAR